MSRTRWLVVGCLVIALAGGGVLVRAQLREHGGGASAPAPACFGDKTCATDRAITLRKLAHDESSTLLFHAMALESAYGRDDCDAATELAGAIERVPIDRVKKPALAKAADDALLGRLGYCALAAKMTPAAPPPGSTITLERGGCYGTCPIYTVTIRDDGLVTWKGKDFVTTVGAATHRVDPAHARLLFDAFERMSFAKGPAAYDSGVTDTATADVTLERGGLRHTLHDDASCFGTPSIRQGTCYLELRIDEIAETEAWVDSAHDR